MKRGKVFFILIIVIFILTSTPLALSYLFKEYTVQDGLCQTQVISIFQDSKGRMWFGTYGGISVYDGVKFKSYFVSSGLLNTTVYSICEDSEGKIWVGTQGGVFYFKDNRFNKVHFKKINDSISATQLVYDPFKERFFIGFSDKILEYYPKTGSENLYKLKYEQFKFFNNSTFLDKNGNFFFTDGDYIYTIKEGRVEKVEIPEFKKEKNEVILEVSRDLSSLTWYIMTSQNFYTINEGKNEIKVFKPEDSKDTLMDFVIGKDKKIWMISTMRLFSLKDGKLLQVVNLKNTYTSGNLNKIYCDYEGNIWIGKDDGILKKTPENIFIIKRRSELHNDFIWCIEKYRDKKFFIGTDRGLQFLDLKSFKFSKPFLKEETILGILKLSENRYVILTGNGIYYFDGKNFKKPTFIYKKKKLNLDGFIFYKGYKISETKFLLAGESGLIFVNGKKVGRVNLPEIINRKEISDILNIGKNRFLLATYNGIYYMELIGKTAKNVKHMFLKNITTSLIYKSEGKYYVGTLGLGIFVLSKRLTLHALEAKNKLNNLNIWCILEDKEKLWIGTSNGISYYDLKKQKFEDFNRLMCIPYSEIPSKKSFYITDGYILFGTSHGIVILKREKEKWLRKIHPKFIVNSILVDNTPLKNIPEKLKINYKTSLTIDLRCLSFLNENGNSFYYWIKGLGKSFSKVNGNTLFFRYLKPGHYRLVIFAKNSRGIKSKENFTLELIVTPPFFQTIWFQIFSILFLAIIISGLSLYKYRKSKMKQKILEKEVEKRTRELKETEERYKMLVESSLVPVYLVDFEGNIVFSNEKVREILDLPPDEPVRNIKDYILPDDYEKVNKIIKRRKEGFKDHLEYEIRIVSMKGEIKNIIVHSVLINHKGENLILANALEITKQKSYQKRLTKMQKLEALSVFAGGIAHNLNNLLQVISGNISILKNKMPQDDEIRKEIDAIEENLKKISEMVSQILGFSGKGKYLIEFIEINELLEKVIEKIHTKTNKNIDFLTNFEKSSIFVEGDKNQLWQVFYNVLLNSVEAIRDHGKIFIETKIISKNYSEDMKNHILEAGKYVKIVIEDNGVGFDPSIKDRIFDPFFTTKDFSKHKGFGLSTAYGIVKNHDGYIYIDSKEGVGTRVEILLPLSSASTTESSLIFEEEKTNYSYIFEDKNIAIFGDEATSYKIKRALENFGFHVSILSDDLDDIRNLAAKNVRMDVGVLFSGERNLKTVFFKILKRDLKIRKLFLISESEEKVDTTVEKVKTHFDKYELILKPVSVTLLVEKIKTFFIEEEFEKK